MLWNIERYTIKENFLIKKYKYIKKYKSKSGKTVYVYPQSWLDNDSKYANERVKYAREKAAKYNSGYYFDKGNPGNMEAEKQQANYAYQRIAADARRLEEKAEQNKKNQAEYDKSFQKMVDDGKDWLERRLYDLKIKLGIH